MAILKSTHPQKSLHEAGFFQVDITPIIVSVVIPAVTSIASLVIHRCIALAITRTIVAAMMLVPAMRATVIHRLRRSIDHLRLYIHGGRLVIDRCWLHVNRLGLNINGLRL